METEIGVPIDYDADKDFNTKVLSRGDKQELFTTSISQLIDNEREYVPPNPLPERLHDERGPIPQNAHPDSTFSSHLHNDWTHA